MLRIEDVAKPVPAPDEILVRIRATGITRSDAHLRAGEAFVSRFQSGLLRPGRKILGHELAGEVEAVGAAVTEFEVGDRVFGALPYLALSKGAHAEYMCVPERFPLAHMPDLQRQGERVLELERPVRSGSRGRAKSDALDALRAARAALTGEPLAELRSGGRREALRVLLVSREASVAVRRRGLNHCARSS